MVSHIAANIKRPLPEVWAFLMEPANFMVWMSGVTGVTATDGMKTGSVITFTSIGLGKQLTLKARVTENNGRDHFSAKSIQGPVTFLTEYRLTEDGETTVMEMVNHIDANAVFKLAEPLLDSITETKNEADLHTLKVILEASSPAEV